MPRYSSAQHHLVEAVRWDPPRPAERVNDFIWMSRGTSNGYLVASEAGDVIINCGAPDQGARYRERFEQALGRPLNVKKIVLTQNHFDHVGGWEFFAGPGVETIVQQNYPILVQERAKLGRFFAPRGRRVLQTIMPPPDQPAPARPPKMPEPLSLFDQTHAFEVGGRRFELYSASSGETLDSLMVWLPAEKIAFTGNWAGALYGALPHFYTLRGDRQRSVAQFMRDLERLIGWGPELLITGHDEPIAGAERVRGDLTRLLGAIRHVHDATLAGMDAGKPLSTLMQEIELPPDLQTAPGRGPVSWYVRAIYEEYTGWFRHETTSELYAEPASSIWPQLAAMAGGPEALVQQARERLAAKQPVQALHFLEIALAADPQNRAVREAEIEALEQLIDRSEGRNFDELGWLETKIAEARAALGSG